LLLLLLPAAYGITSLLVTAAVAAVLLDLCELLVLQLLAPAVAASFAIQAKLLLLLAGLSLLPLRLRLLDASLLCRMLAAIDLALLALLVHRMARELPTLPTSSCRPTSRANTVVLPSSPSQGGSALVLLLLLLPVLLAAALSSVVLLLLLDAALLAAAWCAASTCCCALCRNALLICRAACVMDACKRGWCIEQLDCQAAAAALCSAACSC
jgi:hypothetical protein